MFLIILVRYTLKTMLKTRGGGGGRDGMRGDRNFTN